MSQCPRFGKWIGGCKFEPRYDLSPANLSGVKSLRGNDTGPFIEGMRAKTYVRDVCVRCGKTIERRADTIVADQLRAQLSCQNLSSPR